MVNNAGAIPGGALAAVDDAKWRAAWELKLFGYINLIRAVLPHMEQRGSGFARMREAMLNHGLAEPAITQQDGYFVVTLPGPAGDFDRIQTPTAAAGPVTPALEAQLNDRQRRILAQVLAAGTVTRAWCVAEFSVARDTAGRDLKGLTELGLLQSQARRP